MAKRATMTTVKICTYVYFFAKVADIMKILLFGYYLNLKNL